MARTRVLLSIAAVATLAVGCTQDFNQFLPGQGGGGNGTTSSIASTTTTTTTTTTVSSSSTGMCSMADTSSCPPPADDCHEAVCPNGTCMEQAKAEHSPCMSAPGGAGVCDATATCIGCIDGTDCPTMGDLCFMSACVPPGCTNTIQDGMETDIDCGGTDCGATCMNTEMCDAATDCISGFCPGGNTCAACTQQVDCGANYCDTGAGTCLAKKPDGAACTNGNDFECANDHCVEGVCCESACGGGTQCNSCLAANTGTTNGSCDPITNGQDPHNFCPTAAGDCLSGACDGNGACGFKPNNTNCGTGPSCLSSTQAHAQDKCNATGTCNAGGNTTCTMNFSCDPTNFVCNTMCADDTDCANSTHCDQNGGALDNTCHTCVSNAMNPAVGCMAPTPGCDLATDTCVQCAVNANCTTPGSTACDTGSHTCKACAPIGSASAFCTTNGSGHACITGFVCGCTGDGDCTGIANKTHCASMAPNTGTCQECDVNTDCNGNTKGPICSPSMGTPNTCGCNQGTDCASTVCLGTHVCQ